MSQSVRKPCIIALVATWLRIDHQAFPVLRNQRVRRALQGLALLSLLGFANNALAQGSCTTYAYYNPYYYSGTGIAATPAAACATASWNYTYSGGIGTAYENYTLGPLTSGSPATQNAIYQCNGTLTFVPGAPVDCTYFPPGYCGVQGVGPTKAIEISQTTCAQFYAATVVPLAQPCKDCVGNSGSTSVDPASGNVFSTETDLTFPGSPIAFSRYYNSGDATGTDSVPGWRHSYDASVATNLGPPTVPYPGASSTVSAQYSSASSACTSGFSDVQASVSAWASASASWDGYSCSISAGGSVIGTLPLYSTAIGTAASPTEYDLIRDNGQIIRFPLIGGTVTAPPGAALTLSVSGSGFTVTDENDNVESYNSAGVLQSITSRAGVVQTISYDSNGLFQGVTDSFGNGLSATRNVEGSIASVSAGGQTVSYSYYDGTLTLVQVTNADSTTRSYQYGNSSFPNALTGKVDENGTQYASWTYNSAGLGATAQGAGGANAYSLTYNSDGSVGTSDALSASRTFTFTRIGDVSGVTGISGSQCPTCQNLAATTYDTHGWVASRTDYNGNLTCYANDATRGLELVRVEGFAPGSSCPSSLSSYTPASGTRQRKITTTWSSTYRLPASITEYNRSTSFSYDTSGNLLTKTVTDTSVMPNVSRTWTYTYNSFGQVLTAQGPRTDLSSVTTYTYYSCTTGSQCGHLQTVTDPIGNVTTYSTYNAYGQPLTITDPNGVVTTLTYDARERLLSRQVGSETTSFAYYPTGQLEKVTLPDSSYVLYSYDNAHRLTQISDGVGNSLQYTLDAMGNRTAENTYDPSSVLHRTHSRVYNTLSELYKDINAAGGSSVTTTYAFDYNGNQTQAQAPLSRTTSTAYDELNRVTQITDPNSGYTYFGYDPQDNLTGVQDPLGLVTSYSYNGFGDVAAISSPDTGATSKTYDSGGNLATSTDARGAVSTYSYDALNRMISAAYKLGSVTDQTISFGYDSGTDGKGRLTSASDANHSMAWTYDSWGRVTGKGLTVGTVNLSVGYAYTSGDETALVTPSGQSVAYGYNSNHQVTSIAVNGTTVLSGVTYEPFGGVNGWTWGDSTASSRTFNGDGLIDQIVTAGDTLSYTFDDANRITGISDSLDSTLTWGYGYDLLDRLTSASTSAITDGWTYDVNGNRLTQTGTTSVTFSIVSGSNQLNAATGGLSRSYSYDAAGNTVGYSSLGFAYNNRGRMAVTTADSTDYLYNALGQMIEKSGSAGTTILMQDETGHLLGEYDGSGNLVEETVWLGDIPVATLVPNGTGGVNILYVHSDHLNMPRKIAQPSTGTLAWRWDTDPFGTTTPNNNPGGLGTFNYNLRYPGQYYDSETGLNYNTRRDYDSATGRYLESDPIGLGGGVNTYTYVRNRPIMSIDPRGLYDCTYSITAHSMSCTPGQAGHPSFSSNNYVSGNNGLSSCQNCQNNPDKTNVANRGPIPVGTYAIGGITSPGGSRRRLTPDPVGRTNLELHGCPNPATCSDGCIGATTNADRDLLNQDLSLEEGQNTLTVVP